MREVERRTAVSRRLFMRAGTVAVPDHAPAEAEKPDRFVQATATEPVNAVSNWYWNVAGVNPAYVPENGTTAEDAPRAGPKHWAGVGSAQSIRAAALGRIGLLDGIVVHVPDRVALFAPIAAVIVLVGAVKTSRLLTVPLVIAVVGSVPAATAAISPVVIAAGTSPSACTQFRSPFLP